MDQQSISLQSPCMHHGQCGQQRYLLAKRHGAVGRLGQGCLDQASLQLLPPQHLIAGPHAKALRIHSLQAVKQIMIVLLEGGSTKPLHRFGILFY